MPSADPTFVAFLVGALSATAGFAAYLVRDSITDSRKQRDVATTGWQGQTTVTEKLADALHERNQLDEKMIARLTELVQRQEDRR